MEEDKYDVDKFMSIDQFISELTGYHEQIKQLKASEVHYKQLSAILQETLDKYRTVLDYLPQKVFLKDKNLSYLLANENYARFLGVSPQQISGKTDHDFFPFETAEQILKDDRAVLEKGVPAEHEGSYTREGRAGVEKTVKSPVQDASGETVGLLGISWDITDQKAREEDLGKRPSELARLLDARNEEWKAIQEKFQSDQAECQQMREKNKNLEGLYGILFENTGTAVAVIEDNRVISRVNAEFEKFFGYSRGEVEGAKNLGDVFRSGENRGDSAPPLDPVSLNPGIHEVKFLDRQNKERTVSMNVALIPDTNQVMVSLTDITKYKQARADLNRIIRHVSEMMSEVDKGVKSLDE
jgi:PAS domain S-box-containing protein